MRLLPVCNRQYLLLCNSLFVCPLHHAHKQYGWFLHSLCCSCHLQSKENITRCYSVPFCGLPGYLYTGLPVKISYTNTHSTVIKHAGKNTICTAVSALILHNNNLLTRLDVSQGQFQNQPPIDWLKKYKIENNILLYGTVTYINCITSPHSCHPHLGTCCTVTLGFVVTRQRTVPPSYVASCWLQPMSSSVWKRWVANQIFLVKRW